MAELLVKLFLIAFKFVFKILVDAILTVILVLATAILKLAQLLVLGALLFPDWFIYWVQWVAIAYSLFILAYNLALKIVIRPLRKLLKIKIKKKSKKKSQIGHLFTMGRLACKWGLIWLRMQSRALVFFVVRRLPRLLWLLGRRGALALWYYAKLAWCRCCWRWGSVKDYRRRAARDLWSFWDTLDEEAWDVFRERVRGCLLRYLGMIARDIFYGFRDALWGHGEFLWESLGAFVGRPFTQRWTIFRFFKHLLGITFGITFFYYGFLWCAYVVYFCCDLFFLVIKLVCLKVLQPLFFPEEPVRGAFLKAYESVVEPLRSLVMDDLFTHLPDRVKALKDRIFPEAWFIRRVLQPGLEHLLEVLLPRWGRKFYRFVTITAYYQTRYFAYQLERLVLYFWFRRFRYRRRLGRFMPRALYLAGKSLLRRMAKRLWWRKMGFHLRDMWRWFSFVWRRYLLLPRWRRLQYGYKRRQLRLLFKLRFWAVWLSVLWPLLFWGGLLGALCSLAFFFFS